MKAMKSRSMCLGMAMLLCTFLLPQQALPQRTDSLFRTSSGSLQFQLFGGLGIYYFGDWGPASYFRVGIDASWNHTDNSGDGNNYSTSSTTSGLTSSSLYTSQPAQNSTSYRFSISGVYAQKIAGYANAALYCGAGPTAFYSYDRSATLTTSSITGDYGTTRSALDNSRTGKVWGIGPLALLGVRSGILDHLSLSAEVSISALYQWTSETRATSLTYSYPAGDGSASGDGGDTRLKGWSVALSSIRIGVIVDL